MDETKTALKLTPEQNREVWAYVNWIIATERQAYQKRQQMRQIREHCLWILRSEKFSDEEALKQVKGLIR